MAISLVIADDHEVVRAGLKSLFHDTEIKIVAEADNGNTALKLTLKHKPDLALLAVPTNAIVARCKLFTPVSLRDVRLRAGRG